MSGALSVRPVTQSLFLVLAYLLRGASAAPGGVVVVTNSAAIGSSAALRHIHAALRSRRSRTRNRLSR